MRRPRRLWLGLLPLLMAGCLSSGTATKWLNPFPLLRPPADADTALVQYVVIERTAGRDDINRRAWDRVDEQILSFDQRTILEETGLRVGIAGESAPGRLRQLIDDPRNEAGHRARTFAMERPAALNLTGTMAHAKFTIPAAEGGPTKFARDRAVLGFDLTVKDGGEGKVVVKFVPRARYHDVSQMLTTDVGERGQSTETFPAAGFEVTLFPSEYLVVGTDSYWEGTFGHAAFTAETNDRRIQRLLVLRAGRTKSDRPPPAFLSGETEGVAAPPLASQASAVRGARP